jgi:hypothetical protein
MNDVLLYATVISEISKRIIQGLRTGTSRREFNCTDLFLVKWVHCAVVLVLPVV